MFVSKLFIPCSCIFVASCLILIVQKIALIWYYCGMSSAPGTPIPTEGVGSPKANKGKAKASPKKAPTKAVKAVASPKTAAMKKAIAAKASATKAKAKASVKAKAGSSKVAKAGSSKEPSSPAKGKGSAGKDDEDDVNPIKRPAVAKGSIKDLNKRLLEAAAGSDKGEDSQEEEEAEEEDGEGQGDDVDSVRDRRKRDKFNTLLSQNKLPGHIIEMWFKGVQNEKNHRGFKTKMINALFERDSKGRLIMKPEAPFFYFLQAD